MKSNDFIPHPSFFVGNVEFHERHLRLLFGMFVSRTPLLNYSIYFDLLDEESKQYILANKKQFSFLKPIFHNKWRLPTVMNLNEKQKIENPFQNDFWKEIFLTSTESAKKIDGGWKYVIGALGMYAQKSLLINVKKFDDGLIEKLEDEKSKLFANVSTYLLFCLRRENLYDISDMIIHELLEWLKTHNKKDSPSVKNEVVEWWNTTNDINAYINELKNIPAQASYAKKKSAGHYSSKKRVLYTFK